MIWTCVTSGATSTCQTGTSTDFVLYNDWLFINQILIFCVSFIAIGLIFSLFKSK